MGICWVWLSPRGGVRSFKQSATIIDYVDFVGTCIVPHTIGGALYLLRRRSGASPPVNLFVVFHLPLLCPRSVYPLAFYETLRSHRTSISGSIACHSLCSFTDGGACLPPKYPLLCYRHCLRFDAPAVFGARAPAGPIVFTVHGRVRTLSYFVIRSCWETAAIRAVSLDHANVIDTGV